MKIYKYMAASALLLAVAACNNDDEPGVPSYDTNPNAVRIQPSVSGIAVTRTTPADDTQSTQFNKNDKIKVSRDGTTFYEYTFDGDNWSPTSGSTLYLMWGADETEIDLQAYYPASASMNSFTLPQDQSGTAGSGTNEIADADYMTYNGKVTKGTNNTASFAMQRRTARICVTIDGFGDQYDETSSTCEVKICSPHTTVSVNYSGAEPVVTGTGSTKSVTPLNGKGMKKGSIATALIVPSSTEMSDANFMEVTVNNETTPLYVKGIPTHEAGYSYDYHLTVGKDGIVINSVQVKPWNDETVEGGTAAEEKVIISSGKIQLLEAGNLTTTFIEQAVADGTGITLTLSGPMNDMGAQALLDYFYGETSPKDTHVSILDMSGVTELTEIKDQTFRNATYLKKVTLPASVTSISAGAFIGSGLETLTADNVTNVGEGAFSWCEKLTELSLSSVTTFGNAQFILEHCTSLTTLKLTSPDFDGVFGNDFFRDTPTANVDLYIHKNLKSNKVEVISSVGTSYQYHSGYSYFDFKSITLVDDSGNPVDESTL